MWQEPFANSSETFQRRKRDEDVMKAGELFNNNFEVEI